MERLLLEFEANESFEWKCSMQQVALPSLNAPHRARFKPSYTPPFPLVRPSRSSSVEKARPRKFVAGLLFGVLMSLTLVLFGYEARIYFDTHPDLLRTALDATRSIGK
jgi:hypothetical protein